MPAIIHAYQVCTRTLFAPFFSLFHSNFPLLLNRTHRRITAVDGDLNGGASDRDLLGADLGSGLIATERDLRLALADCGEFDQD